MRPRFTVERVRVENFRGFEEAEYSFNPEFNLIVGDNATGKTSLIEAIAVLVSPWIQGATEQRGRPILVWDYRRVQKSEGGMQRVGRPFETVVSGVVNGIAETVTGQAAVVTEEEVLSLSELALAGRDAMRKAAAGEGGVYLPLLAYYGTERVGGAFYAGPKKSKPETGDLERERGYERSLDARISTRWFTEWMRDQALETFERDGDELPQSVAARRTLADTIDGVVDVRYSARIRSVVAEFEDGRVLPTRYLSQGQRRVLRLVGDIAWRMIQLNAWLEDRVLAETPGVVLIDELGLHLHPKWERRIVDQLRTAFPSIQFVATSHSPFIVQSMREGELISLDTVPVPQTSNLGVDDIAEGLMDVPPLVEDVAEDEMGVEHAEVSERYLRMKSTARAFMEALEASDLSEREQYEAFQRRLAEDVAPYADNPAYQAFLEMKLAAKAGV